MEDPTTSWPARMGITTTTSIIIIILIIILASTTTDRDKDIGE